MFSKRYSLLSHTSQYRWLLLPAILFSLVAVLPIAQKAQRQPQLAKAPAPRTKKKLRDAVPGEILVVSVLSQRANGWAAKS
jgi:hypothetical protein